MIIIVIKYHFPNSQFNSIIHFNARCMVLEVFLQMIQCSLYGARSYVTNESRD